MELQIGEYRIPDGCTAKIVGRTIMVYKCQRKTLMPNELRCKDCKHRVLGKSVGYFDTWVCDLKPKKLKADKVMRFHAAPKYGKPCECFELNKE